MAEFWVNGSAIPEVEFDVGDSWAGLLPISNATGETRQVCVVVLGTQELEADLNYGGFMTSCSSGSFRLVLKEVWTI